MFLVGRGATYDKLLGNMEEIAAPWPVIAMVDEASPRITKIAQDTVVLPKVESAFAPIVYAVAVQLFFLSCGARLDVRLIARATSPKCHGRIASSHPISRSNKTGMTAI